MAPSPCLRHSLNQRILHFRPHPSSHGINWGRSLPAGTETYYFPQSATTDSNSPIHPSSNRGSTFSPTPPPWPQPPPPSFAAATLQPSNQLRTINSSRHGDILFPTICHGLGLIFPPPAHHPKKLATITTTLEAPNKYHHPCCYQTLVLWTPLGHQHPPLDDIGLIEYGAITSWPRSTTSPDMILKNTFDASWSSLQQILMTSNMTTFQKRKWQDSMSLEMHGFK